MPMKCECYEVEWQSCYRVDLYSIDRVLLKQYACFAGIFKIAVLM